MNCFLRGIQSLADDYLGRIRALDRKLLAGKISNGKGKDSKGAFEGIDGKPSLFHYPAAKEAGIHKIFLTAICISSRPRT
jgi:hypothetical protein